LFTITFPRTRFYVAAAFRASGSWMIDADGARRTIPADQDMLEK
jgi:hypothetical protein